MEKKLQISGHKVLVLKVQSILVLRRVNLNWDANFLLLFKFA